MILCDFSILYHRTMFGSKTEVIENPDYLAHLLMNGVLQNFKDYDVTRDNRLVLAIDCKKHENWRYKYYEENSKDFKAYTEPVRQLYKGNRKKDNELPWERIYAILEEFLDIMIRATDVQVIQHKRAEADDVVAVGVRQYGDDEEIDIISSDSDFHQLLSKNVKLWDPIKKKHIVIENSKNVLLEAIMTGQKRKDNIFPIKKGFGAKTAQKKMGELKKLLAEDKEMKMKFEFNKTLIDLNMLPDEIEDEIVDMFEEECFNFNHKMLVEYCHKYKLRQHMENLQTFRLQKGSTNALY